MDGIPSPPSASPERITLIRDGHDSIELALDQVTPSSVARIYSVSVFAIAKFNVDSNDSCKFDS